ncbi:hypothetical protein D3C85_1369230 [compost metagenome]
MLGTAGGERVDIGVDAFLVDVDDQVPAVFLRLLVAQRDHVLEFPGGIHVHQRERRAAGGKGLLCQMQHHRRILADGVQHHRVVKLGGDFTDDVDGLGFKLLEVSQPLLTDIHLCAQFSGCWHRRQHLCRAGDSDS